MARAAIYVIKNGKSASIWMIDQNNLYSYDVPYWGKLRKIIVKGI